MIKIPFFVQGVAVDPQVLGSLDLDTVVKLHHLLDQCALAGPDNAIVELFLFRWDALDSQASYLLDQAVEVAATNPGRLEAFLAATRWRQGIRSEWPTLRVHHGPVQVVLQL